MEDNEIIQLYFERDERAISETALKYGRLCRKIAHNIIGDEDDADECVNDTYFGVWRSIPPAKPSCLRAFVAKIARNKAIERAKYLGAAKRNPAAAISLSELEEVLPDTAVYDDISEQELGKLISDFLYTEKEDARKIFIRKYWFLDSVADIAEHFGYSESKVKSILFRTRNGLRKYLTEKGVSL